jgi:hypothetical protein
MKPTSQRRQHWFKTLIVWTLVLASHTITANEENETAVISPIRLNKDMISGIGLEAAPWEDEARTAKWSDIFTGQELSVSVFESAAKHVDSKGKAHKGFVKSYPYDQFVLVLSGKSVLTDVKGHAQTFSAGDLFVVPKGFSGTWEEHGIYRELIVILEEAKRTRKLEIEPIQ